jgi:hypothetical protein
MGSLRASASSSSSPQRRPRPIPRCRARPRAWVSLGWLGAIGAGRRRCAGMSVTAARRRTLISPRHTALQVPLARFTLAAVAEVLDSHLAQASLARSFHPEGAHFQIHESTPHVGALAVVGAAPAMLEMRASSTPFEHGSLRTSSGSASRDHCCSLAATSPATPERDSHQGGVETGLARCPEGAPPPRNSVLLMPERAHLHPPSGARFRPYSCNMGAEMQ